MAKKQDKKVELTVVKSLILDKETNDYLIESAQKFSVLTCNKKTNQSAFLVHMIRYFKKVFGTNIEKSLK